MKGKETIIWSENRQSLQVPGWLGNTLIPFLSTCGSSLGPLELLKKKISKCEDTFWGVI